MKETRRFFDKLRTEEDNFWAFHKVGDVSVLVSNIDVKKQNVVITLNPDIQQYQRTKPHSFMGGMLSKRSIEHESSQPGIMNVNQSIETSREGKRFILRVIEIGEVTEGGAKNGYCDIEVEAVERE